MNLPSSIKYGTVKWTALNAVADDAYDPDRDPNSQPLPNVTVTFTASIPRVVVQDPSPITIFLQTITARTNANGVLTGPDGLEGIKLVATDNVKASPVNFTYRVNISGIGVPITFDIAIPADATIDLSFLVPVVTSAGKVLVPKQGEKGDPGGWIATPLSTTQHLDTVTTPGLYYQGSSTAASPANGYPANMPQDGSSTRGVLEVFNYGGAVIQRYTNVGRGFFANSAQYPRITYSRTSGTMWSNWTTQTSQRVDNTAGRAIYTWDDTASREQLIYGDTGVRDITELLDTARTAGTVYLNRSGNTVTVAFTDLVLGTRINLQEFPLLPLGFRPRIWTHFSTSPRNVGGAQGLLLKADGVLRVYLPATAGYQIQASVSFYCGDSWPTTLPGTAIGNIPNI